jgi:hypothetical protein
MGGINVVVAAAAAAAANSDLEKDKGTTPSIQPPVTQQPSPRKGKAWLIIITIAAVLIAAYIIFDRASISIRHGRGGTPIGVEVVKADILGAKSTVYRKGLGRFHTGEELCIFRNIFLLKNEATLRFRVRYNKEEGIEFVWVKLGNKYYIVMKPWRKRGEEKQAEDYLIRDIKRGSFLKGEEADKLVKFYIQEAEKKLEAARQQFASEIKEAEELRMQWEKEHPRPPRKEEGPPPDRKKPETERDSMRLPDPIR